MKRTVQIEKRKIAFFRDGKLHRNNGPASIWIDDIVSWWTNGKCVKIETNEKSN